MGPRRHTETVYGLPSARTRLDARRRARMAVPFHAGAAPFVQPVRDWQPALSCPDPSGTLFFRRATASVRRKATRVFHRLSSTNAESLLHQGREDVERPPRR